MICFRWECEVVSPVKSPKHFMMLESWIAVRAERAIEYRRTLRRRCWILGRHQQHRSINPTFLVSNGGAGQIRVVDGLWRQKTWVKTYILQLQVGSQGLGCHRKYMRWSFGRCNRCRLMCKGGVYILDSIIRYGMIVLTSIFVGHTFYLFLFIDIFIEVVAVSHFGLLLNCRLCS